LTNSLVHPYITFGIWVMKLNGEIAVMHSQNKVGNKLAAVSWWYTPFTTASEISTITCTCFSSDMHTGS